MTAIKGVMKGGREIEQKRKKKKKTHGHKQQCGDC